MDNSKHGVGKNKNGYPHATLEKTLGTTCQESVPRGISRLLLCSIATAVGSWDGVSHYRVSKAHQSSRTTRYIFRARFPFGMLVDLNSRGCRKLETVNTGVPIYVPIYERMRESLVLYAETATVLLLLYSGCTARVLFKCRGSVGLNPPAYAQNDTHTYLPGRIIGVRRAGHF